MHVYLQTLMVMVSDMVNETVWNTDYDSMIEKIDLSICYIIQNSALDWLRVD